MRTMLKLILLCSLAQFAIAQNIKPEGCGTTYKCLAPVSCDATRTVLFDAGKSYVLDIIDEIKEDCAALIKFHAYRLNWVNVKLESYGNQKTIKLIHRDTTGDKTIFTCNEIANNKWEATYQNIGKSKTIKFNNQEPHKCDFEVKLGGTDDKVYDFVSNDEVLFEIDSGSQTISTGTAVLMLAKHCDPSNLNFDKSDPLESEVYTEVQHKPNEFYCNNKEISKLKYRGGQNPDLKTAASGQLICKSNRFYDGTVQLDEYLDVRCVADVQYFCNEEPLWDTKGKKLDFTRPDKPMKIAGVLKCPSDHPHLFIKGKPVFKEGTRAAPGIVCSKYGATQQWTVNGVRLTSRGPGVHCSNKLVCKDLYKIQQSSVLRGTLDTNGFPSCFASGTLHEQSGGEAVPSNFRCDESTGEFKYDLGGAAKNVEGMKFECRYPKPVDVVAVNKANEKRLAYGVIGSAVGVGVLVIALVGGCIWFARWSYRREQQRREAADKAAYEQYALNKAEKAKLKAKRMKDREQAKKNNKAAPSSSSAAQDDEKVKQANWNPVFLAHMSANTILFGPTPLATNLKERVPDVGNDGNVPQGYTAPQSKHKKDIPKGEWKMIDGTYDKKYHKEEPNGWITQEKK